MTTSNILVHLTHHFKGRSIKNKYNIGIIIYYELITYNTVISIF